MKRNSVIPTPQIEDNSIIVSFQDEANGGRLRNVTVRNNAIAAEFQAHQAELDAAAEEYTQKRKTIEEKRATIEEKAFAAAEKILRDDEAKQKAAREEAGRAEEAARAPKA